MKTIIRHGDISFKRIDKIPSNLKEVRVMGNTWVAAEGETTGHRHLLTAERMTIKQDTNGRFFLSLGSDGQITHEEHKTLVIPMGEYEVIREREFDWFQKTPRQVID